MRGHDQTSGAAGAPISGGARTYDAIVVGAGAAGGLAALLLAEANLEILVLDAGWRPPLARAPYRRSVNAVVPRLAELRALPLPFVLSNLGQKALKLAGRVRQPVQSKNFAWPLSPASFVDDRDFPYAVAPGSRFDWFRVHQVGGRMTVPEHGRQYHRLDAEVFDAHWPIGSNDLDPWYELVEARLGVAADAENTRTPGEEQTLQSVRAHWPHAHTTLGRSAPPLAAMELAAQTGRMHCKQGAVVRCVDVDNVGRVNGVTWVDSATREVQSARAPIVFLCASALETARILMSSSSPRSSDGVGAASGALGRYLMDHITMSAEGEGAALPGTESLTPGRCVFVSEVHEQGDAAFGMQIYRWSKGANRSQFNAVTFGEMAPRAENRITLDTSVKDACGNPTLRFECEHNADDFALAALQSQAIRDVAGLLDVKLSRLDVRPPPPGTAMHECGTARMGDSPENSVLDPDCQAWDAKGLYVTDGAAFPSQGTQHPTLTIQALTARACAHAIGASARDLGASQKVDQGATVSV